MKIITDLQEEINGLRDRLVSFDKTEERHQKGTDWYRKKIQELRDAEIALLSDLRDLKEERDDLVQKNSNF